MVRKGKILMVIVLYFLFSAVMFGQGNQKSSNEKNQKLLQGVQGDGFLEKSPPGRRRQKEVETQAKVYYQMGKYLRLNPGNEKTLPFINNSDDRLTQGDEYLVKGIIYSSIGDNLEALEMYEKAQVYFKNTGDLCGLWWLYLYKGDIYFFKGDYSTALEMYKEAFWIYERIVDIIE